MSSILKALKKLEEEKAARRNGSTDVAKGILRSIPRQHLKSRWILPVSIAGSALAAALLTYILTGGKPSTERESVPEVHRRVASEIPERKAPVQAAAPAVSGTPLPPVNEVAVAAIKIPGKKKKDAMRPITTSSAAKLPARLPENKGNAESSPEVQSPATNNHLSQKNSDESMRQTDVHSRPLLRVSGIAWNRDSSERLAVVNGMPVSEGTTIEGARVEEILKDKVRFSFEKRTFDVAVGN